MALKPRSNPGRKPHPTAAPQPQPVPQNPQQQHAMQQLMGQQQQPQQPQITPEQMQQLQQLQQQNQKLAASGQVQVPAVAEQPPKPLTPTEKLRGSMTIGAWQVLVDLVHWAEQWQMTFDGQCPEWSEDVMINLLRPFIGFGPHPEIWQYCIKIGLGRTLIEKTYRWVNDESYRKQDNYVWVVVSTAAPILACETKQYEGMKECHAAMAELESTKQLDLQENEQHSP